VEPTDVHQVLDVTQTA